MKKLLLLFVMACLALPGCVQQTSGGSSTTQTLTTVDSYVVDEYYTIVPNKIDDKLRVCGFSDWKGSFSISMPKQESYYVLSTPSGKVVLVAYMKPQEGKKTSVRIDVPQNDEAWKAVAEIVRSGANNTPGCPAK